MDMQHLARASSGQALSPGLRWDMERGLGESFGDVRMHTGAEAARATRAAGAAAFAEGEDVWLGDRAPAVDSLAGRLVIAHELAHVAQQRRGGSDPSAGGAHEADASRAAVGAVLGQRGRVSSGTGVGVARVTLADLEHMFQAARDYMSKDPKVVGAAGEGAYMGRLGNEGASNINANEFSTGLNTPYIDVVSSQGVAQVKTRGTSSTVTPKLLRQYEKDFDYLVNPENHPGGDAEQGVANAKTFAKMMADNRGKIGAAWPKDLPPHASEDQIFEYLQQHSILAIASDHVDAVRKGIAASARLNPKFYGLDENSDLTPQIEKLVERVQPIGLKSATLDKLSTDYVAKRVTKASDVSEDVVEPPKPAEAVKPADPVKPVEPPKPADPVGPSEPVPTGEPVAPSTWGRIGGFLGTWGGRALAGYAGFSEAKRLHQTGHGWAESIVGGLGMSGGFLAGPALLKNGPKGAGAADLIINLVNLGANLLGAPQGVTDVTSTVASATPSQFIGAVTSQGSRAWLNIFRGDVGAIDHQVTEMQRGQAGAPLQGYSLLTELAVQLASGKDVDQAITKAGSIGKDSSAARIGGFLGDMAWVTAEAGRTVWDIGKHVAAGEDLDQAIMTARKPDLTTSTKWIERAGDKLGDASFKLVNEDLPAAKAAAAQTVAELAVNADLKIEDAKRTISDTYEAARDGGVAIKDHVVDATERKLEDAKNAARKLLGF